ncbi:MAG TPA: hypothetical protein VLD67_12800 [Vicinamibacterales bacterium]|nr:hypothetical protein [Vicinamibacterales bacterium]
MRSALVLLVLCATAACDDGQKLSPVTPDAAGGFDTGLAQEVRASWSPYVGVHADGDALHAYQDSLSALQRAGRLNGVRVEIHKSEPTNLVIKAIGALGIELLGLVANEYLFEPDIESEIDRIFSAYPEIRYFQIGNEVTTILPPTGPTITIEEYAAVFQRVYDHVQARHPGRATLLTQSSLGSGLRGPTELETLAGLALARMDPDRVIIAINAYDPHAVGQFRGLLGGTLRTFRVWVTESGVADPTLHVPFVQEKYPLLRQFLRAERVYWYVMWGGDSGPDTDFSLIKQPASYPHYWKSPLFELLTGVR